MTEELTDDDRRNLRDTVVAAAVAVDDQDEDLLGDLFTDDATFELPEGVHAGRAAIVESLRNDASVEATFHVLGQSWFWVDEDDDTINGDTYCVAHQFGVDGSQRTTYLRYADEFTFDDRWRISSRDALVVRVVHTPGLPAEPNPN